jgi:hypothetical protein
MLCIANTPYPGPRHDVAMGEILAPTESIFPEQPLAPVVIVRNRGDYVEPNVQVFCRVDSAGQQVYQQSVTIPQLDTLDEDTLQFPNWDVGPGGNLYDLTFWHHQVPDTVRSNDTCRIQTFALDHDVAVTGTSIGDSVRAGRPTQPVLYLENVGGYREQNFWTYCRVDSSGAPVYSESVLVDTLAAGATRNVSFPAWNVGPVNITYRARLRHACPGDGNPGNDSLSKTTTSSVSMLRVAVEVAESSSGRTRPNACYVIDSLCRAWGWTSAIVKGTDVDEWQELNSYDVLVTGDGGTADNDFRVFDNFLLRWVRSGGGYVGLGWLLFGTYYGPGVWSPMDSLCPVMVRDNYGFVSGGAVRVSDTTHPVTRGVAPFPVFEYGEFSQAGLWQGAQQLGYYSNDPTRAAVAVKEPGRGRAVYLGPIYFGDFAINNNEEYFTDVNSLKLLRQALEWAASGPGAGTEAPPENLPTETRLTGAVPNPTQFRTQVGYSLPQAARVKLAVYDLAGKKVRTLVSGAVPAGVHRANWNLTDEAGRAVSKGVYFCRLDTEDGCDALKVVVR